MADFQSADLVFEVRPVGAVTPFLELICAVDDQAELDNEVNETVTRCGKFSGVGDVSATYSGNAMADTAPSGTQVTYAQIAQWQKDRTALEFRYYNLAQGTVAEGAVISHQGQGRFTNTSVTGGSQEVVLFSWTFTPSGEILINESIS